METSCLLENGPFLRKKYFIWRDFSRVSADVYRWTIGFPQSFSPAGGRTRSGANSASAPRSALRQVDGGPWRSLAVGIRGEPLAGASLCLRGTKCFPRYGGCVFYDSAQSTAMLILIAVIDPLHRRFIIASVTVMGVVIVVTVIGINIIRKNQYRLRRSFTGTPGPRYNEYKSARVTLTWS